MFSRFLFETGRLAPHYDYFRCVVNIPEDVQRVGEPSEAGEQVHCLDKIKRVWVRNSCQKIFLDDTLWRSHGKNVWCSYDGWQGRT